MELNDFKFKACEFVYKFSTANPHCELIKSVVALSLSVSVLKCVVIANNMLYFLNY